MKNTKLSSIILAVITILSMVFDLVKDNAELWGLSASVIAKVGSILTIIKLIYDNRGLFSEAEIVSFGNYVLSKESQKREAVKGSVTHADFYNWKEENRS